MNKVDRLHMLRNAGKGYTVYHGTKPERIVTVEALTTTEAIEIIGLCVATGILLSGWLLGFVL